MILRVGERSYLLAMISETFISTVFGDSRDLGERCSTDWLC
jgi:hypothetical protein